MDAVLAALQSDENTPESTYIVIHDPTTDEPGDKGKMVPTDEALESSVQATKEHPVPRKIRSKVAGVKHKPSIVKQIAHHRKVDKSTVNTDSTRRILLIHDGFRVTF